MTDSNRRISHAALVAANVKVMLNFLRVDVD